jgi:hypothetical protein
MDAITIAMQGQDLTRCNVVTDSKAGAVHTVPPETETAQAMNTNWAQHVEAEMNRLLALEFGIALLALMLGCWITYHVIKAAIRDGIKESGLVRDKWHEEVEKVGTPNPTSTKP